MLKNLFAPLEAAAKGLQHVSLLQGTKAYGAHIAPFPVPARERWPRHQHENFYWLQEDYLREKQVGKDWRWTILRPQLVFGEAIGSNLNVLPAIGVYAALRREAGLPLSFPGGPPYVFEAVDVDLLARSFEWAATTPACGNEIFNIANGDVRDQPPPPMIVSTIKARQAGFHDCMDTEDMFGKWFRRFQELRLLPPR